ncbi:signal recognition particle 9 kDa protein-domain-containing protein [Xylariales sp. AK1849]|nr:signal recognition particle 9 kDa protein-domain-containing protein [Xylariales sp. AK1849]
MPYYETSDEWLRQSQLLLEARPTTTRITTRYSIKVPKTRKPKPGVTPSSANASAEPKAPRGALVLKTYDPVTGAALKYRTTKAAEVSRLVMSLGKLSRPMAGLPELKDELMPDVPAAEGGSGAGTPALEKSEGAAAAGAGAKQAQQTAGGQQSGGGGKGKKKRGKK